MYHTKKYRLPKFWSTKTFLAFLTLWIVGNFIMVEGWRDCCERRRNLGKNDPKYGTFEFEVGGVKVKMECDAHTDDGAGTIIQRRWFPPDPNGGFNWNLIWEGSAKDGYTPGFGKVEYGKSYWLGLWHISNLTTHRDQSIRFYMERWPDDRHRDKRKDGIAHYDHFYIGGEETNYTLDLSGYNTAGIPEEEQAGDALLNPPYHEEWNINGMQFSTWNCDNDANPIGSCNSRFEGGWWYSCGGNANPNGKHYDKRTQAVNGIVWGTFDGWYSLKSMRIVLVNKDRTQCGLPAKRKKTLEL